MLLTFRWIGVWCMVASMWVAQIVSLAGRVSVIHRAGYVHRLVLRHKRLSLKRILGQLSATSIYVIATQLYLFSFTAALTALPSGGFACFKYAEALSACKHCNCQARNDGILHGHRRIVA